MTQKSLHWDGASLGDADTLTVNAADGIGWRLANEDYTSPFVDLGLRMLLNGDGNRGVLKGWANELVVAGVATPITVGTGGAIVYGMPYENTTAAVNVAVPSPVSDTRYDYIVLRRDWAAQTIRVTRIPGVEGGGIPTLTQSPAPDGTGIYDVPLATIAVTTGGVITCTDAREYCRFGTGLAAGALTTANLTNDSIDWADRATGTKRMFIGAPSLQPALNAGRFDYVDIYNYLMAGAPTWNGAANEEAWRHTGTNYRGVNFTFRTPPDYYGGAINLYTWWVNNAVVAATFYIRMAIQSRSRSWLYSPEIVASEYITASGAVSDVYRTAGAILTTTHISGNTGLGGTWNGWVGLYNTAGTEDIGIMGVEIEYTGYI